jgi:hypothetical protein
VGGVKGDDWGEGRGGGGSDTFHIRVLGVSEDLPHTMETLVDHKGYDNKDENGSSHYVSTYTAEYGA